MASQDDIYGQIAQELMRSQTPYGQPIDLGSMPTDYADGNPSIAPDWHSNIRGMADQYNQMPEGRPMMPSRPPRFR